MTGPQLAPARDLAAVAELMNAYWPRPCWRYSQALLGSYLARPGARDDWRVELRLDGTLHGFMAATPWRGRIGGAVAGAAFTSFLTVSPQAAAFGGAQRLIRAVVERLRGDGVTDYLTALEAGQPQTPVIERLHARAGLPLVELLRIRRWLGVPRLLQQSVARRARAPLAPVEAAELDECAALLAAAATPGLVAQTPDAATLGRILLARSDPSSRARRWRDGGRLIGLLLARQRDVLDHRARRNLHVDWLVLAPPAAARGAELLAGALAELATPDLDVVVVQDAGDRLAPALTELQFLRTAQHMKLAWGPLDRDRAAPPVRGAGALEVF